MTINFDKIADAVYVALKKTKVKETKTISDKIIVDFDAKGDIIGIEILNISSQPGILKSLEKNVKEGIPIENISAALSLA